MSNGQLSYSKFFQNFNTLAKGAPKVFLPEGNQIEGTGEALVEQMDDLVLVLSDLPQSKLAEMEQSISEATQGFVMAAQSFRTLKEHGRSLLESTSYEMPKVGQAIDRVANTYEQLGQVYKALLTSVRQARQLEPSA